MEITERSINFKVKVEPDDLIHLRHLSKLHKWGTNIVMGIGIYLIVFMIIICILFAYTNSQTPPVRTDISQTVTSSQPFYISMLPTILVIFIIAIAIYCLRKSSKRRIKKHYESNKQLQKEFEYTFTDIGIEAYSESVSFKYNWDEVYKVTETKSIFAIYESNSTVLIIPKRCITDDLKIQGLKVLFISKMSPKKYKIINC